MMNRLILLYFVSVLLAQERLNVESNLVIINVSARSRTGRPIANLKKNDFVVSEDGVPQALSVFESHTSGVSDSAVKHRKQLHQPDSWKSTTVPRGSTGRAQQFLTLLFDLASMGDADVRRSRAAAIRFVDTNMATEDNLSLVTLGGTQSTVMGFTANRNALLGALRQVGTIGVNSRPQSPTFAATNGGLAPVGESELDGARRLSALQDAVRALGIYPGKKALVYFSGGVERVGLDHIALYRRLFDSAVQSDVSVYAIDARGLMALPPGGDASTGSSGGSGILYGTIQQSMRNAFYDSQEGLYTLASETGGSTFVNSNDLITGIRQAQEDVSSYYELGFYSATASDGKYHKLHVQLVEADKGNLNYRRGYYPIPRVNPVHTVNDTATFKSERSQAAEATKVSGAIEVEYLRVAPGWYSACLSIVWPWFNAEMSGEIDNAEGQPIAVFRRPPGLSMENVGPSTKLPGGWHCDAWLALPPGMYSLIGEARSIGKTSALEGAFSIPKSGPKGELNISSLFMEKRGGAQSLVDQLKTLDARPLNLRWAESRDGLATNADGERVFHEDQGLQLHFEVYDRGMGSGLVAQVTLLTETQIAFESSTLQPLVEESSDGVAAFEFAVPLQKVVPGHYTVQVTIVDERDRKVAFLRRGLALVE